MFVNFLSATCLGKRDNVIRIFEECLFFKLKQKDNKVNRQEDIHRKIKVKSLHKKKIQEDKLHMKFQADALSAD